MGNALSRSVTRLALIVAFAAGIAACSSGAGPVAVERYRVSLNLTGDGVLDVGEDVTARFAAGPAAFERRTPPDRFDDVLNLRATLDGRQLSGDAAADLVAVRGGRAVSARWTFPAVAERPHQLALAYRVSGALQLEGRQRRLTWRVFEPHRTYVIDRAIVELRTPPGVSILMPSGMAEAGWQVSVGEGHLVATRDSLPAAEPGTLLVLLSGDALPLREPQWQFDMARAGQLAPAFAAGGAFIVVVALGIVLMLWRFDRRQPATGRRRQLQVSAAVVCLAGALCALIAWWLLGRFGWWPHAIGLGLVASALLFYGWSFRYPRAASLEPRAPSPKPRA
jgi:hypothetical protein